MNSPAVGIGYAFWLRLRWAVIGVLSLVLLLAISVQLVPAAAVYCCGASMVILFAATVYLLNAFTLGPADLGVKSSGFPMHMRVLPVSTHALVGWPMLFAAATFATLWALPVALIFMPAGIPLPILWPAAMFATVCLWVQAIGWSPFPSPFARVPMLILALGPMTVPLSLGAAFYQGTALTVVFSISCLIWSIAAYVFGVNGLSRARTGSEGDWFRPITQWWASRAKQRYAAGTLRRPFRSAFTAQLWHECRRNAILLSAMTAFVGLPMLLVLSLPILSQSRQQSLAFGSTNLPAPMFILMLWAALPTFFAITQGGGMAKLDIWGKTDMPAFFATRPVTTSRFVLIKLCAIALGVAGCWLITFVLFAIWAALEASPLNTHESIIRSMIAQATPRTIGIFILALIGIMAITWRNVASGMWPTLTGRKHIANGIGFGFLAVLALLGCTGMWFYQHPAHQEIFWRVLPWLFGAEVSLKLILAVVLHVTLQRRGLVTPKTMNLLTTGWLLLAVLLIGGLSLFVTPTWTLAAIVVLLLPFPSLAAAPLAMDWNRHR